MGAAEDTGETMACFRHLEREDKALRKLHLSQVLFVHPPLSPPSLPSCLVWRMRWSSWSAAVSVWSRRSSNTHFQILFLPGSSAVSWTPPHLLDLLGGTTGQEIATGQAAPVQGWRAGGGRGFFYHQNI